MKKSLASDHLTYYLKLVEINGLDKTLQHLDYIINRQHNGAKQYYTDLKNDLQAKLLK